MKPQVMPTVGRPFSPQRQTTISRPAVAVSPVGKPYLYIVGMHGMGDCLHQRAVLRQLMRDNTIILETSWPAMYHDLAAEGLTFARRRVGLRTQQKNADREADKFGALSYSAGMRTLRIAYGGGQVLSTPSKTILEVMCNVTHTNFDEADYRLPVPDAWRAELFKRLGPLPAEASTLPWLVYRPLVARTEWRSSIQRNADPAAYDAVWREISSQFFTISVADLEPGKEWLVGPPAKVNMSFHKGELNFEALVALFAHSGLVLTSSGFAAILAPAVGTPCISIVGGYEDPRCHDSAKKFAPYLAIGPRTPCSCWTGACRKVCNKSIDIDAMLPRVREFVSQVRMWS